MPQTAPTRTPSRPSSPPRPSSPSRNSSTPAPQQQAKLDFTPRKAAAPCPRIVFYAGEKFGKTTFGAYAPDPFLLMAKGETGYDTLLSAGLVPAIPAMVIEDWQHMLNTLDAFIASPGDRKTLILDAMGGYDMMAQTVVCNRDFKGDWNSPKDGFLAFGADKGYRGTALEWTKLLSRLDVINGMGIVVILLGHATKVPFRNPLGADYDQFTADLNKHSWAVTARWSDCILFGKFFTVITDEDKKSGKGKGIGGSDRVIYTESRDAFSAGNRYAMVPELWLENNPATSWGQVWAEITRDKSTPAE
jgi:hypothetical protein